MEEVNNPFVLRAIEDYPPLHKDSLNDDGLFKKIDFESASFHAS